MNILPLEKEQFIINNNYILREIGEDIVLIPKNYCKSKIKSNLYSFQGVGADVIRRIDGIATIKTIINDLINIYDVNYKVLVHDVKEFLKYLVIQGIVNSVDSNMHREILPITDIVTDNHFLSIYQNNWSYDIFCREIESKALASAIPVWGTLELTYYCNLRCKHCYLEAKESLNELSKEEYFNLLSQLRKAGCLWLIFTGGEPLIRKDFKEIYLYAKQEGFIIFIFTNGTLIDDEVIDYLKKDPPFSVDISLYGLTQSTYESITSVPGSHSRCMDAINALCEAGINIRLKTPLLTLNIEEVKEMYNFAQSIGAEFMHNPNINPMTNSSLTPCNLRVDPDRVVQLDQEIPSRKYVYENCPGVYHKFKQSENLLLCNAGKFLFCVDPFGKLQTCVLFREPSYDLREINFEMGWQKLNSKIKNLKPSKYYRCGSCEDLKYCTPCPGWAKWEYGEYETPLEYLCQIAQKRHSVFEKKEVVR